MKKYFMNKSDEFKNYVNARNVQVCLWIIPRIYKILFVSRVFIIFFELHSNAIIHLFYNCHAVNYIAFSQLLYSFAQFSWKPVENSKNVLNTPNVMLDVSNLHWYDIGRGLTTWNFLICFPPINVYLWTS